MIATPRADDDVRRFYTGAGRRMFEERLMTAAIRAFLVEEERMVGRVMKVWGRDHLVEVGCGPGRYLPWAVDAGYDYDGVDLVSELVEQGRHRFGSQTKRGRLHVGTAEDLSCLFADLGVSPLRALVLFPFNCFGNLARVERAVRSLSATGAPALVSVFDASERATLLRMHYYRSLGCDDVEAQRVGEAGVLVTSKDGLNSYAYSTRFLTELFQRHGLLPSVMAGLGGIARLIAVRPAVPVADLVAA